MWKVAFWYYTARDWSVQSFALRHQMQDTNCPAYCFLWDLTLYQNLSFIFQNQTIPCFPVKTQRPFWAVCTEEVAILYIFASFLLHLVCPSPLQFIYSKPIFFSFVNFNLSSKRPKRYQIIFIHFTLHFWARRPFQVECISSLFSAIKINVFTWLKVIFWRKRPLVKLKKCV